TSSRLIASLKWKRREMRRSVLIIFGLRKVLRPLSGNRFPPPDPVRPLPPDATPDALPETPAEYGKPEPMVKIGAMLKSPRSQLAVLFFLLKLGCQIALATNL